MLKGERSVSVAREVIRQIAAEQMDWRLRKAARDHQHLPTHLVPRTAPLEVVPPTPEIS